MSTNTRRSAHRVACRFPVVVEGRSKPVVLQAEDVSRNGMKLRVPRNQLQLPSLPTLGQVAGALSRIFPEETWATLDPERLGPAVKRRLRVVRIVRPILANEDLRVGCYLTTPLAGDDGDRLGLDIPAAGDSLPDVSIPPAPLAELRALVVPQGGKSFLPFEATPVQVDAEGLVVRVSESLDLPLDADDMNVRVMAFAEQYGDEVQLRVSRSGQTAWQGPARLQTAEEETSGALRLGFSYGRPLGAAERAALRVA